MKYHRDPYFDGKFKYDQITEKLVDKIGIDSAGKIVR